MNRYYHNGAWYETDVWKTVALYAPDRLWRYASIADLEAFLARCREHGAEDDTPVGLKDMQCMIPVDPKPVTNV